jgi:phosphate acetyltransferase
MAERNRHRNCYPESMRTSHQVFEHLIGQCRGFEPVVTAVVYPLTEVALQGAVDAAQAGLIEPLLIGPRNGIQALARNHNIDVSAYRIEETADDLEAARRGVLLCRSGECRALMKGSLQTDHFLHAVMADQTGLRTGRRISHIFALDVPAYPRTLLITDAAINIYPKLEEKADIVQNAIDLAQALGINTPRVAILSAVETVTPAIISTIDAAALCKMADRGQITGGVLDGPLAFDNAIDPKAAEIKQIHSVVAGQADVLVVPDLESGNMLAKQLEYFAEAEAAGVVLGARVPIILTSRADSAKTRLASAAVAALLVHQRRQMPPAIAA